ncbi:MAG: redoxin domain-containing protein [Clostridia bacterium]|nr:redoxin domain-containing protein [Clostridia bacterium]
MKKQVKWILAVAAFVVLLIAAGVLYRHLSQRVQPNTAQTTASDAAEETAVAPQTDLSVPVTQAEAEAPSATEQNTPDVQSPSAVPPAPTQPAPEADLAADFTVLDRNGNQTKLSDHFGKPLVVNFWASWCGPCRNELPAFDAAAKAHAGDMEFMMVNLTDGYSETVDGVNQFIADNGFTFPVYYDTEESAANAYSVYSIPLTVFIRADGTVLDSHIGSMDETALQSYLDQLTR